MAKAQLPQVIRRKKGRLPKIIRLDFVRPFLVLFAARAGSTAVASWSATSDKSRSTSDGERISCGAGIGSEGSMKLTEFTERQRSVR
jgi:hypothetical protein